MKVSQVKVSQMLQLLEKYHRANIKYCDVTIIRNEVTISPTDKSPTKRDKKLLTIDDIPVEL